MSPNWKDSVYSDGSKHFVSNPNPSLGETITVKLRVFENSPVKTVLLRYVINGTDNYTLMEKTGTGPVFSYYSCSLEITQPVINYHFMISAEDDTFYYNQLEITNYPPAEEHDFRIIAGFESPEWVNKAVFYQIFPDRFYNGNTENDVKDNEYVYNGHATIRKNWNDRPCEYHEGFNLDFFGGDIEGIIKKIPYLKSLGVNAIYLNPIFLAASNHKYDCADYFTVDPHFGGNRALEELIKELRDNEMFLIIDVSFNHTGSTHKWFNREHTFFPASVGAWNCPESEEREFYFFDDDNGYDSWFNVDTLPVLNYSSEKLRDIIYRSNDSVIQKWMNPPYGIDGWRFDVAYCMARRNELQLHHQVWPEIRKVIKGINPEAYILAEHMTDCIEFLNGFEWDASMNYFGFGRPVRQFLGEPDEFVKRLAGYNFKSKRIGAEEMAIMFMQHLARLPHQLSSIQYNLFDSHDVPRLHNNPDISFESYRAAVIMLFTFPGTPSIYYGDETGLDGHIHTVEGCRYPMQWDENRQRSEFLSLYRTLAHLKRNEDALQTGGFKILYSKDNVISYARFNEQKAFIAVCSQDKRSVSVSIPAGLVGVNEKSVVTEVFDRNCGLKFSGGMLEVKLEPYESVLIQAIL